MLSSGQPRLSVIIVTYESGALLLECLESLREQNLSLQVIVVNNGSEDPSIATAAARFPGIEVVRPGKNLGFAGGANAGARHARAAHLLILNPDVRLGKRCAAKLLVELQQARVGVVGPRIELSTSDTVELGSTIDSVGYPVSLSQESAPLFVSGSALATRTALFRQLNGFDERFFMFMEDVDYCWRVILSGFDVRVATTAVAFHVGGASTPGGYLTGDGFSTTTFRIHLKERNTLTMLLKCYGLTSALLFVPTYVCLSLGTAALLALSGRRPAAAGVMKGLVWNVRQLGRTLELRQKIQATRVVPDRAIRARMHRGLVKLTLLRKHGLPHLVDNETRARALRDS